MEQRRGRKFDTANGVIELTPFLSFMSGKKVSISELRSVTVWGVGTVVFPKVGLTLHSDRRDIRFDELDVCFQSVFSHYKLEHRLPDDWYTRAESGEQFHVELTET